MERDLSRGNEGNWGEKQLLTYAKGTCFTSSLPSGSSEVFACTKQHLVF